MRGHAGVPRGVPVGQADQAVRDVRRDRRRAGRGGPDADRAERSGVLVDRADPRGRGENLRRRLTGRPEPLDESRAGVTPEMTRARGFPPMTPGDPEMRIYLVTDHARSPETLDRGRRYGCERHDRHDGDRLRELWPAVAAAERREPALSVPHLRA